MTDRQALRKLIEAVEGGAAGPETFVGTIAWEYGYRAFHGSLDAAKALHEALLPEDYIVSSDSTGFAHVWRDEFEVTNSWTALIPGNEARARLLAILLAYEAQQ